jgi:hypothetical protein
VSFCFSRRLAKDCSDVSEGRTVSVFGVNKSVVGGCLRNWKEGINILNIFNYATGPGSSVGIATELPGCTVRGSNPGGGARFSTPVQTGPVAHTASCTMGTGSLPGGRKRPGRDADPEPPSSAEV